MTEIFNPDCSRCHRLVGFRQEVKASYPDYHCRPVAPFGDAAARLLIVGLAPGMHGANATGRPFTGDYAGILLYETLNLYGFSNKPVSKCRNDGLKLQNCRITNAVKCLPPENKPLTEEVKRCNNYLANELDAMPTSAVVLALGTVAHKAVLRALGLKLTQFKFAHGHVYAVREDLLLVDSYHCSRYNTQTGRLTTMQFHAVFDRIQELLSGWK